MKSIITLFLISIFFFSEIGIAQETDSLQSPRIKSKLVIGITETPPFIVKEGSDFSGLSISSWELINETLNLKYEYKTYPSLIRLMEAVENNEVDLSINPVTVTNPRMKRLDFSQPYFISYTGIAKKSETMIWSYLANMFSWKFLSAILILLGVILLFGFLVWLFERKKNKEEFGGGVKGIFHGFWWSAVTMTTVGYGDKSPKTFGGRFIGLIWMFMAIIMISSLTAGIASSLTVQNISDEISNIQDLDNFEVITVAGSSAQELLNQYNIRSEEVANEKEGIQKIQDKESALFVYDQPILKFEIDRRNLNDELEVLQQTLKRDYYSYSFPKGSMLVKEINPVLIATLKTMEWNNLIKDLT
ncbi:ligand-gated ion channel [Gillisia sp. Hel_I_86]|uniref:transporter substrate-binding domain-containing protein n=1 Tax=Gillisia sp. Hel_I_86 TaxID=1249981 RepID=UPI001198F4F1|nr:transporter substrate-binding domain-containing protein [Gillisia sp. Hel_I_86]TVZ26062.1 ligand-gated ion channel [Gillisia sp. Hel_I_86]